MEITEKCKKECFEDVRVLNECFDSDFNGKVNDLQMPGIIM